MTVKRVSRSSATARYCVFVRILSLILMVPGFIAAIFIVGFQDALGVFIAGMALAAGTQDVHVTDDEEVDR